MKNVDTEIIEAEVCDFWWRHKQTQQALLTKLEKQAIACQHFRLRSNKFCTLEDLLRNFLDEMSSNDQEEMHHRDLYQILSSEDRWKTTLEEALQIMRAKNAIESNCSKFEQCQLAPKEIMTDDNPAKLKGYDISSGISQPVNNAPSSSTQLTKVLVFAPSAATKEIVFPHGNLVQDFGQAMMEAICNNDHPNLYGNKKLDIAVTYDDGTHAQMLLILQGQVSETNKRRRLNDDLANEATARAVVPVPPAYTVRPHRPDPNRAQPHNIKNPDANDEKEFSARIPKEQKFLTEKQQFLLYFPDSEELYDSTEQFTASLGEQQLYEPQVAQKLLDYLYKEEFILEKDLLATLLCAGLFTQFLQFIVKYKWSETIKKQVKIIKGLPPDGEGDDDDEKLAPDDENQADEESSTETTESEKSDTPSKKKTSTKNNKKSGRTPSKKKKASTPKNKKKAGTPNKGKTTKKYPGEDSVRYLVRRNTSRLISLLGHFIIHKYQSQLETNARTEEFGFTRYNMLKEHKIGKLFHLRPEFLQRIAPFVLFCYRAASSADPWFTSQEDSNTSFTYKTILQDCDLQVNSVKSRLKTGGSFTAEGYRNDNESRAVQPFLWVMSFLLCTPVGVMELKNLEKEKNKELLVGYTEEIMAMHREVEEENLYKKYKAFLASEETPAPTHQDFFTYDKDRQNYLLFPVPKLPGGWVNCNLWVGDQRPTHFGELQGETPVAEEQLTVVAQPVEEDNGTDDAVDATVVEKEGDNEQA